MVVGTAVLLDGRSSLPDQSGDVVTSYDWSFGDGASASGPTVSHVFSQPGVYTTELTVTATDGRTASAPVTITVIPVPPAGLTVQVTNGTDLIAGAQLAVIAADGTRYGAVTDGTGTGLLQGLPDGTYTVYGFASGYLPGTATATVTGGSGSTTLTLEAGQVAQTSATATVLTPTQLENLGLNPNDPANQNDVTFQIHLAFTQGPQTEHISFSGYGTPSGVLDPSFGGDDGGGGGGGGGGCVCATVSGGKFKVYPQVQYVNKQPSVVWMIIPGKAQWLKEFFDVKVLVSNLAPAPFSFDSGQVALNPLPPGLSLAPLGSPQSMTQTMPSIPAGGSASVDWVLRGDDEGYYTVSSTYTGTLDPGGFPLDLPISTNPGALHVWGASALELIVDADDTATSGYPYAIEVGIKNVADVPVYNPSIQLLDQGRLNYIYQPLQPLERTAARILPGHTFTADYRLIPEISGTLDLGRSFVEDVAGNAVVPSIIESQPATPPGDVPPLTATSEADGVHLAWTAPSVAGITGYDVFYTPTANTLFGSVPVATAGPSATSATVPAGPAGYYAVSTLVNGVPTLLHPLAYTAGLPLPPGVLPGLSVGAETVPMPQTGTSQVGVPVTLSHAAGSTVTVHYATVNGSGTAGRDYTAARGNLTFAPGQMTKSITVTALTDPQAGPDRTFSVVLSNPVGATLTTRTATVTIDNLTGPEFLTVSDPTVAVGPHGGTASFTVSLSSPATVHPLTVDYATADGTAHAGTDYTATTGQLTFSAGASSATVSVPVLDTSLPADEVFFLHAYFPPMGWNIGKASGQATLFGPTAPLPVLNAGSTSVLEVDTGTTVADVPVTLSAASSTPVTVAYTTAPITARSRVDFTPAAGTLTFAPGTTTATVPVTIPADAEPGPNLAFELRLSNPSGAVVGVDRAPDFLVNTHGPMTVASVDAFAQPGTGATSVVFPVTLSSPVARGHSVTVRYATADGTAVAGTDYTATDGTLTFTAGQSTATVVVPVLDSSVASDKSFTLGFSAPVGAVLNGSRVTGTIATGT